MYYATIRYTFSCHFTKMCELTADRPIMLKRYASFQYSSGHMSFEFDLKT